LVFEDGRIREYAGGYDDWVAQSRGRREAESAPPQGAAEAKGARKPARKAPSRPRRLSYKEARELESLPGLIEELESRQQALYTRLADPALYREEGESVAQLRDELGAVEESLERHYGRWEELEEVQAAATRGA
jgi:ATP-binding cassette subfamily F protein uup